VETWKPLAIYHCGVASPYTILYIQQVSEMRLCDLFFSGCIVVQQCGHGRRSLRLELEGIMPRPFVHNPSISCLAGRDGRSTGQGGAVTTRTLILVPRNIGDTAGTQSVYRRP
jgi:hypothetical protein